jgi:hypothetical protein
MVTTSKLSRRLVTFLLVWIIGTLSVSFFVTHDDQELLDAGASRSLLDEQEHGMNTISSSMDSRLQSQVQVQSPRVLVQHTDRKRPSRISSRPRKKELPADFVSPTAGRATMCAVRTQHGCIIQPCQQQQQQQQETTAGARMATNGGRNDTIPEADWHYGHGLVHRDNDLRGTTMMTSGQAKSGSGCAMSVKYKFIYIHVLKSAGMTIKAFLKRALCGGSTGAVTPCFQSDNDTDAEHDHEHEHEHDHKDEPPLLEIVDCAAALQEHPDYFVWSFVRNPFARLYSGYSMADNFRHIHGDDSEKHMPAFSFSDFSEASQAERSHMTAASAAHFLPQTNFLFHNHARTTSKAGTGSTSSCPTFDFLGRLEHLDEDLQTVLSLVGSPELNDYVRAHNGTIHHERNTAYGSSKTTSELRGDLRNAYPSDHAAVQAAAAKEYARDFALLGYDPNVIPTTGTATTSIVSASVVV